MKTAVRHFGSLLVALVALMVKLVLLQKLIKFRINLELFFKNKYDKNTDMHRFIQII